MDADAFHRLVKSLVDSGEAATLAEAMSTFGRYGVRIALPGDPKANTATQIIALTAINAASRSFLGNVAVDADDFRFSARGFEDSSLHEFMRWAGVTEHLGPESERWPTVSIGSATVPHGSVRAWADGWNFGIGRDGANGEAFAPACVAAAGLAINETFSLLRGDNPYAGRRSIALSLWNPRTRESGPSIRTVPPQDGLWLVGLGHLGQVYAWTLGFMEPGAATLMLQDIDRVTASTISTSMLSTRTDVGQRKTRVTSRWLEARGFDTALVERRFDEAQRIAAGEPTIALFGVDNPAARRVMEGSGFRFIIDAGLGSGYRDFRAIRVRTFPGPSAAATLWAASSEDNATPLAPGYQALLSGGADQCGVTTLATRAVGAPFVGCVAAGYVVAERIRHQLQGESMGFFDLNLREPSRLQVG